MSMPSYIITILLVLAAATAGAAEDTRLCGNPFVNERGAGGPFDYLDPAARTNKQHIPTVEKYHFNYDVQTGRRGQSGHILEDLDFILRYVPNHHRALYTLINYYLKHDPIVTHRRSAECYLERARVFNPEDGTVRMLAGIYYARQDKLEEAEQSYLEALELMPDSAELHYNLGLLYIERGNDAAANEHAVRAYSLGSQLPGLKRKLIRRKAWNPDILEAQALESEKAE